MSEPMSPAPPPPGPPTGGGYAPPPTPQRIGLPWEQEKSLGTLIETAKLLIGSPKRAFAMMREKGDYGSPILFAIFFGIVGGVFTTVWGLLWMQLFPGGMGSGSYEQDLSDMPPLMQTYMEAMMGFAETSNSPAFLVGRLLAMPILMPIVLLILSAIIHLGLRLVGGLRDSTAGFEGSFRVYAYAQIANLAAIVPLVGGLLTLVWGIILCVNGLSDVHRTSQGKAVVGALSPYILLCGCVCVGLVTIILLAFLA